MSLHAQLSPEALAKLDAQKRNSTISSFVIAILFCSLLVAILVLITLSPIFKNVEELITHSPSGESQENISEPLMNNEVSRTPSTPSSSMSKVIVGIIPSNVAIIVSDQIVTEPSIGFGQGTDFGDGWNNGNSIGNGTSSQGFNVNPKMEKRCTAKNRIERLLKEGGKEEYEDKVISGLKWLKQTQQPDGSWNAQGKPVAMTGLALLCFLGHCETPDSDEYGETVEKAILFLIANGKANGGGLATSKAARDWSYEHPIATYALAEAYTLCKEFDAPIPGLEESLVAAGNLIISNQNENGGWAYSYDVSGGHVDTSVVCWQLQALKACMTSGLKFEGLEKSVKRGIEYLESCEHGKGLIGYKPGANTTTMTPGGVLCFQQWGKGKRTITRNGIKWIKDQKFDYKTENSNLYMHYYASQAMINAGGAAWTIYNKEVMHNLADSQLPDGSWPLPGHTAHSMSSPHYASCLSILMMEVYYRYLPSSE